MPSSVLPVLSIPVASLYPRHPLHGPGAPRCYPACCILPPLAHPSPASFLAPHTRSALSPPPAAHAHSTPSPSLASGRGGAWREPGAGAGHAHHAVLPVPVGALGAPAGRAGAVHGAAAACLALLLHLLPRGRAARGRARVPEPGRPRLLRRREPGGRRAGSPRGRGSAAVLQLGSHSPRVHGSPGSPAVPCGPRASCPSLVSPVLQLQQAHPGHPSWHLVLPWASFWSCRRVMAAAPHWEGGTLAVCTGRLQARDLTSQCTSYHTLLDTLVSVNTIQCFAFQPSLPFPLPSGNLPHFQH